MLHSSGGAVDLTLVLLACSDGLYPCLTLQGQVFCTVRFDDADPMFRARMPKGFRCVDVERANVSISSFAFPSSLLALPLP